MINIEYPLKLLFVKDAIGNKLKGLRGLSLVDNYQHLNKLHDSIDNNTIYVY
jgi:hypothetical protein